MKKTIILVLILILNKVPVFAQNLIPNTTIKGDKISLKVNEVKMPGSELSSDRVYVANVNNVYHGRNPKIPAWNISLHQKMEKGSMLKAFSRVFDDNRLQQLASTDRGIAIFLYITTSGKVAEVGFLLRKSTTLTPSEIEQLKMRSNLMSRSKYCRRRLKEQIFLLSTWR